MSVPLDRLYNHLDGLCNHDILIYRFYPHGSKNLSNLTQLHNYKQLDWFSLLTRCNMICHDQEPLNFDYYDLPAVIELNEKFHATLSKDATSRICNRFNQMHIRSVLPTRYSLYDQTLITHSEKNSLELEKYQQAGYIGVYWWAHAVIARDWFRYAEHDNNLQFNADNVRKDFLIYNRAWTGTREYRLKFTEYLVINDLQECCSMSFASQCDGQSYVNFIPANKQFALSRVDIDNYFSENTADSSSSADYNSADYCHSAIEVVLETLFDDARLHLTEKTLRPIACGKPFILAATAGSLSYVRSYGFKTFDGFINEEYDTIVDPTERLLCIIKEMKRISLLPLKQKKDLWEKLYQITLYNQQLFFSAKWQEHIFQEFVNNYNIAADALATSKTGKHWKDLTEMPVTTWAPDVAKIYLPGLDYPELIDQWVSGN
jgi:hypothetical protein